ncbi:MAG: 50S ribosomal protein L2 [Chloroflexota bacterium]|nr:MAG: 50S ribosomal protein L2 [Chloroflexota bacterium]
MPIKQFKPTSPGRRGASGFDFSEVTRSEPERSLTVALRKHAGRDNQGRIAVRHRGGGHRRRLRLIDFKRGIRGVDARVVSIEYDPNRSARIALLQFSTGPKAYILAPVGLSVGDTVRNGSDAEIRPGNALPLENIPVGTTIHAIELHPGQGATMVRSAGTAAQLMAKDGEYATLRLPSGETRRVLAYCIAVIGQVGNVEREQISLGKAGRNRHLGRRPTVRGSAMTPRDHPHGGGEGKAPIGHPGPKTPWGKPARGVKTRRPKKASNALIVRRRETR